MFEPDYDVHTEARPDECPVCGNGVEWGDALDDFVPDWADQKAQALVDRLHPEVKQRYTVIPLRDAIAEALREERMISRLTAGMECDEGWLTMLHRATAKNIGPRSAWEWLDKEVRREFGSRYTGDPYDEESAQAGDADGE
jgi:hypothetical protein